LSIIIERLQWDISYLWSRKIPQKGATFGHEAKILKILWT
jgi:hypothetical protein